MLREPIGVAYAWGRSVSLCPDCGRPGRVCLNCPRVTLGAIRGLPGPAWDRAPALLHREGPLSWPELSARGRLALRGAVARWGPLTTARRALLA